jgi:outer membrane protein assembly factor BamB
MTDWEQLAFYRKINGVWTMFNQFPVPSAKPLLSSPEGFVANGKSYVAVVACDELGAGGFVGQPVGPSEIWVVGIDPARPFARRIDDPLHTAQRAEPEPFLLDTGPVVFYSEVKSPNMQWLKRASTGLAADTGYDVAHFGGAWSGAFRDNKNCSCTPYGLATQYASAYDVPMQNTQFVHATLGPENQLYYGAIDTTGGGSMRQLVVLDTTTGAEAYRLSEQTGLETLSATNALVDLNGAYYVPGNDALRKYNSGGQLQWAVPTHGLARSAQFAPDGNIVFFTWNGWSYIVSQDGALLAEANMTGSRTFPENPVCLAPGDLSTDCAYVGSPAIDPASKRTFVTQIRTNNTSIVQGFKYQTSPTYLLKNIWGTRITLAGIASNPVLSADHLRLYVQDGVGNLHAYDATNGNLIWTFPLGFTSNSPPVVTANGFIMPGGTVDRDPLHNFVGLVQDQGNSAAWVVQNTSYSPKSFAAAGVNDRFVLMGIDNSTLELKLLVVDPTGVLSASSWGTGDLPTSIQGVSLRDDGWVFVQTSGTVAVKAFAPAP